MQYILLAIPALIAGYYLLTFLIAYCEKEHLRGDLVQRAFQPELWNSAYMKGRHEEAMKLGLTHCGDFHTGPHASMVKGPLRLYLTPARTAVVAVACARFAGMELKKTVIRTRVSEQRAIDTSDFAATADPTGGIKLTTLWGAEFADLLATHEARLQSEAPTPLISPDRAFALYEQIDVDRGQRMVDRNLARWTDPSGSTVRRSIKGALQSLRANKAQTDTIVAREKKRIEASRKK
jgi:hypothetical protein